MCGVVLPAVRVATSSIAADHRVVLVTGIIVPDVQDHLGLDGGHHLGPEDVGEQPAHQADHEQEEGEHNVGEEEALDLLVTR